MVEIIPLTCPSCGAATRADSATGRFRCEYCGNVHLVRENPPAPEAVARKPATLRLPQPHEVRLERDQRGSYITWRWFSWKYIPALFFCLFWDGFLFFWYGLAFNMNAPLLFKLFPILHVAVGLYVTYTTLAGFLNRTNLELTQKELAVWFTPLPWPGEKTIPTAEIQQFFCREKIVHAKNSVRHSYTLSAITRAGLQVELLRDLDSPDLALFLEQQLEEWMNIEDRPVKGEYGE